MSKTHDTEVEFTEIAAAGLSLGPGDDLRRANARIEKKLERVEKALRELTEFVRPGRIIRVEKDMDDADFEALKRSIVKRYTGRRPPG